MKPNVPSHTTNVTNQYDDLHFQPQRLTRSSPRGQSEGSIGLEVLGGCCIWGTIGYVIQPASYIRGTSEVSDLSILIPGVTSH